MRILIAELKQETATFNPVATTYDLFRILSGDEILPYYTDTKTELAGALSILEAAGCELLPAVAATAVSGGPVRAQDLEKIFELILDAARTYEQVDGLYICLHGAMAGEQEPDPEGKLLAELRRLCPHQPLVASLDLHAVLTDRMIDHADVLVPYHTYPHTDHFETGERAARVLLRLLKGQVRPTVARFPLPMLVRGDELLTATGRFGRAIRMCQDAEENESTLAAGVIIGNAFTDVPDLQSNVIVTTDDDLESAQHLATNIARFMWENRHAFQAQLTSLPDALRIAEESSGLVVFSDAADATASGAAGDSNAILAGLLDSGFSKRGLLSIVDAPVAKLAHSSKAGTQVVCQLGGTCDPERFRPIEVDAHIVSLHDGCFTYEDGTEAHAGQVAVLRVGTLSILVTERPVYVVGRQVFEAHGLDPRDFELVVVKSPNGFRIWYEAIAEKIVAVDVPGSTSANLKTLPYRRCVRPIFPLDENVPDPFATSPFDD